MYIMPKHRPIRFKEDAFPEEFKERVRQFAERHPVAVSASRVVFALGVVGGILSLGVVAPGMMSLLGKSIAARKKEKQDRYRKLWQSFYALKNKNVFEHTGEDSDGKAIYQFTEKGRIVVKKFLLETLEIKPPKRWDGKWRIVVSDISEKHKTERRNFQEKLDEMGFYSFQKSVWIHPFPCEQEVVFLKDFFRIGPCVEVFVASEMPRGQIVYHFQKLLNKYI